MNKKIRSQWKRPRERRNMGKKYVKSSIRPTGTDE